MKDKITKFNWQDFKNCNIAVHCKTKAEAKDFCREMNKQGLKWCKGDSYLKHTNWEVHRNKTCYVRNGFFGTENLYRQEGYKILEWNNYMKFDWEEFKNYKVSVRCKTEKEAKDFCEEMNRRGIKWVDDSSYCGDTKWEEYKENTCYAGYGGYSTFDDYRNFNKSFFPRCVEWSDYMKIKNETKKEFTKSNLENGMIVEYRNGTRRMVLNNVLIGLDAFVLMDHIHEDLTDLLHKEVDIIKVYQLKELSIMNNCDLIILLKKTNSNSNNFLDLIWKREEIKEMTLEDIENELGYKIKIVE